MPSLSSIFRKKRPPSLPPAQSVMTFDELCKAIDVLKEEVYCSGESAGVIACQAVPSLELWILENWGTKNNTPIPNEIQRLYDEAVIDLRQKLQLV